MIKKITIGILVLMLLVTSLIPLNVNATEEDNELKETFPPIIHMDGNGTEGNPYQITNLTELQNVNSDLDACYIIMNDIDCDVILSTVSQFGIVHLGFEDDSGADIGDLRILRNTLEEYAEEHNMRMKYMFHDGRVGYTIY